MNYEKSCGAIVYRKFHGNTEILLIRHIKSGYWSFPKGHVEGDETEAETAMREIKEETNIDVLIDTGFRETVSFSPRRDTSKTVVYFVAKALNSDTKPQAEEISEIRWVEIGQALSHLTYDNDKLVVS
ncbi:MAG: NUDIX domain-containing protein, partial [Ruminiclostridium sp.]|nr:NUDIX domain-containing protein [Ruminiclostridium sp.]